MRGRHTITLQLTGEPHDLHEVLQDLRSQIDYEGWDVTLREVTHAAAPDAPPAGHAPRPGAIAVPAEAEEPR